MLNPLRINVITPVVEVTPLALSPSVVVIDAPRVNVPHVLALDDSPPMLALSPTGVGVRRLELWGTSRRACWLGLGPRGLR